MSQSGQQSKGTFERAMLDNGIDDFNTTTEELKFGACKLTIERIHTILQDNLEWTLPENMLIDFADGLLKTTMGLRQLHLGSLGTTYPFSGIMPIIDEARAHLGQALSIFNNEDKVFQRIQHIQLCRRKLEEAMEQIEGFPR